MAQEKRLVIKVDPQFHGDVKAKAKAEDLTVSQVVRRLLREWMKGDPPERNQESHEQN